MAQGIGVLIRMQPTMFAWIKAAAEKEGVSIPAYCRMLVEKEQQRQRKVQSNFNPFKKKKEETTNGVISAPGISGE